LEGQSRRRRIRMVKGKTRWQKGRQEMMVEVKGRRGEGKTRMRENHREGKTRMKGMECRSWNGGSMTREET
jgi:hypothetical protein